MSALRAEAGGVLAVYATALKAEQALLARAREQGVVIAPRVTTLPQLTDALCREAGGAGWVLPQELAAVVVERAAASTPGAAALGLGRGLVREARRTIAEVRAAYLTGADLAIIASSLPPGAQRRRLELTAALTGAYEGLLARLGATDRHGREWRVVEHLAACERAGKRPGLLAGVERVVFAEIYDYSPVQFLIATSLIRLVGDAELVAFAHPENVDATRFLDRTWNRFVSDPGIADQVLPGFALRAGRRGNLATVLRHIFTAGPPPPREPPDGTVRMIAAPGRYREVEAVGREIRAALAAGRAPERIAILARDLAPYGDLIEDVCRRFRIPVYFRKGKPLCAVPLVKELLGCLRLVVEGFPRRRLEALLSSGYFRTGAGSAARVLLEAGYIDERAVPLEACLAELRERLSCAGGQGAAAGEGERLARLGQEARRLLGVRERLGALAGTRTVGGHVRALAAVLARLGFHPLAADECPGPDGRRDALALEAWESTLAGLVALGRRLPLGRIGLDDFVELLEAALEEQQVEDRAARAGAVRALSVADARGLDFDIVYILGLDDGTFPAPRPESPLWPDSLKRTVNPLASARLRAKLGPRGEELPLGALFRTAREGRLEDPFLFFLALSMATESVVLCYPTLDERGNATVPSPFLEEVRALIAEDDGGGRSHVLILPQSALIPPAGECADPAELVNRAVLERWRGGRASLARAVEEAIGEERLGAIARRAVIEEQRARERLAAAAGGEEAREAAVGPWSGRLATPRPVLVRLLLSMSWSPTRLEELAACPFRFFAHHLLGLDPAEEPAVEVGARELGSVAHRVLQGLLRAHRELPADPLLARAAARSVIAEVRKEAERTIAAKDPAFLDLAWERVGVVVEAFIDAELEEQARRKTAGLEVLGRWIEETLSFRLPDRDGRLGLGPGPALALTARPDRVDLLGCAGELAAAEVTDYKASRRRDEYQAMIEPRRRLGTTAFQIPVYLMGVLARLEEEGRELPANLRGGYLLLLVPEGRRLVRSVPRDILDLDASVVSLSAGADEAAPTVSVAGRILDLVGGALAGRFDVAPALCAERFCPYRHVCRNQVPAAAAAGGEAP